MDAKKLAEALGIKSAPGCEILALTTSLFHISGTPEDNVGRNYSVIEFGAILDRWRKLAFVAAGPGTLSVRGLIVSNGLKAYYPDDLSQTVMMQVPIIDGQIIWEGRTDAPSEWSERIAAVQMLQSFARFLATEFRWRATAIKVFGNEFLEYSV